MLRAKADAHAEASVAEHLRLACGKVAEMGITIAFCESKVNKMGSAIALFESESAISHVFTVNFDSACL